jgi:FAD/FMN-containing dehydrogenase
MRRRDLFKAVAALAVLSGTSAKALAGLAKAGFRRVRPGDAAWPKPADWAALDKAVDGALLKPEPLHGPYDNPFSIGDQAAGTQVSGWLNAWKPGVSAYAVKARKGTDVASAVSFARRHKLRLVVKGGAHSYQGTSNAPDSLLVWTRAMNKVEMIDGFVPQGCGDAAVPAVSVEAGAMWIDVYDAVTTKGGRYAQGGGCTTVGVAGHVQSGGFGSFSKRWGTAAGSLLEAEIVTADGKLRTVNRCQDPELFWGIKGGGGGSLGVVTKLILRTHDLPEHFGGAFFTVKAASDEAFRRLVGRFIDFYAEALFNPHWGEQAKLGGDNMLEISMVCQGLTADETKAVWKPFLDWLAAAPADYSFDKAFFAGALPARVWWDPETQKRSMVADTRPGAPASHVWWRGDQEQCGMFLYGYESLWLPAALLDPARRAALSDALVASSRHATVGLHFNKGLAGGDPQVVAWARDTATNPEAADAFALVIIANGGPSRFAGLPDAHDDDKARRAAAEIDLATAVLAPLAPAGGSYVSESNFFNRSWATSFWGANYPRLLAAKRRYDPDGLFFVHHGVGSEDWSEDGFTRL